jgi:exodeoxyribonuclease V beta subunit
VADFDAATIATTHGFCQEVLAGLGVVGDVQPGTTFVEDIDDLVEEVVDDLYVRRFHGRDTPDFDRAEALRIARVAVANSTAPIEPAAAPEESIAAMRVRLAVAVREELERRKRRMAVMTYDDLLTRLDGTLRGPGGAAAAARLQRRHHVVLVDEFQDTDPVQWDILRRAFSAPGITLVLIGDPKQAIYAFRGADVYAYLDAARAAGDRATLEVNWRSDQGLIDAYDALFGGAQLGHEGIVYRTVRAAPANQAPRLSGAPVAAPLRLRVLPRDAPGMELTRWGCARNAPARAEVAKDLAADVVALLSSSASLEVRADAGTALRRERVRPRHVAVLVRTHRTAQLVLEALDAVDVPAVVNGAGSVFGTVAATDWLRLLEALERPAAPARARAAALTPFLGWTTEQVAAAGEDALEELHRRLHQWAHVLRDRGVASLFETITLVEGLPRRVLSTAHGERRLTDLRHVGQLLHAAAAAEQMGTTALAAWLRRRIAAAEQETSDEERSRRLESDAEAVQILTIHRSKGLEFPIVYCPFLWEPGFIPRAAHPVAFHDPDAGDARTIDVGMDGPDFPAHRRRHEAEQRGEDLRLAYVALTRAQHQAVVWWAGSWDSRNSALGRLLFARGAGGEIPPAGSSTPSDAAALARMEELAAEAPGCISVERAALGLPASWSDSLPPPPALAVAPFDRRLDHQWRRTSYSDITAAAHEARVASEPEEDDLVADEVPADGVAAAAEAGLAASGARGGSAGAADLFADAATHGPGRVSPVAAQGPVPAAVAPPGLSAAPAHGPAGVSPGADEAALRAVPSLLSDMPSGVHVGTFVHRVLEAADFAAQDLDAELTEQIARVRARRRVDVGDTARVAAGLRAAIETPLGPALAGARLRDFPRADRLDELAFELPLVGGDEPTGEVTLAAVAGVLRRHEPAGGALAGYADRLGDPALRRDLRGYLGGSLDLVVRRRGPDGVVRFAVVDYKTNRLGAPGEPLTAWHHRPAALAAEMTRAHYGLQALLYAVALHRYLRWRVPGYDPARQLAGVLYLFLRGMTGERTPIVGGMPCGVFAWRPSATLVEELSDVLDRGEPA